MPRKWIGHGALWQEVCESLRDCGELTFHGHLDLHPNQNALALLLLLGLPLKLPVLLRPMGSSMASLVAFLSSM